MPKKGKDQWLQKMHRASILCVADFLSSCLQACLSKNILYWMYQCSSTHWQDCLRLYFQNNPQAVRELNATEQCCCMREYSRLKREMPQIYFSPTGKNKTSRCDVFLDTVDAYVTDYLPKVQHSKKKIISKNTKDLAKHL